MTLNKNQPIVEQTKAWVETVIVKHNICPFAAREVVQNNIRYSVFENIEIEQSLECLINECEILDHDEDVATSLLIYPDRFLQFEDYLDFVEIATMLMFDRGYEGIYQLASFHPDYCFAEIEPNDASNYTNRSPYPMLHIIRESSLEKALKGFPNPERLPEENIELTRKLGLQAMQAMLQACYNISDDTE